MNNSFSILAVSDSVEKFMKATVEEYSQPAQDRLKSIGNPGDIAIIVTSQEPKSVHIVILHEKVANKVIKFRLSLMSQEVHDLPINKGTQVFFISKTKIYPGNFTGEFKKDFVSHLKSLVETVDKSVRIGGLYMAKDLKDTAEAKARIKEVEEFFAKHYPGLEISFRWSDNSGKPVKIDSAGYNVLAKNTRTSEFNSLFKSGTHYYSKHKLFIFTRVEEKQALKIESAAPIMIDMIKEYTPEIIEVKVEKTTGKIKNATEKVTKKVTKKEAVKA